MVLNVADEACSVTSYSDDDSSVHQKADDVTDDVIDDVADSKMSAITCNLETKELWEKFHQLGTEMIITKSGRYLLHPLYFCRCSVFFAYNSLLLSVSSSAVSRPTSHCISATLLQLCT